MRSRAFTAGLLVTAAALLGVIVTTEPPQPASQDARIALAPAASPHTKAIAAEPSDRRLHHGGDHSCSSPNTEKAAHLAQILRDYDELRAQLTADFHRAGDYEARLAAGDLPGPAAPRLDSTPLFLRELALLERERRADLQRVLTPADFTTLERDERSRAERVQHALVRSGLLQP